MQRFTFSYGIADACDITLYDNALRAFPELDDVGNISEDDLGQAMRAGSIYCFAGQLKFDGEVIGEYSHLGYFDSPMVAIMRLDDEEIDVGVAEWELTADEDDCTGHVDGCDCGECETGQPGK
jgi:hypothetical protein